MIPKFRGLSIDENSKGEWQYGHLIEDRGRAFREDLGMFVNSLIRYNNFERLCNVADNREILGNVYENPELLEVE